MKIEILSTDHATEDFIHVDYLLNDEQKYEVVKESDLFCFMLSENMNIEEDENGKIITHNELNFYQDNREQILKEYLTEKLK